jgi:hypothetical protein
VRRLLAAALLVGGALAATPAASACTIDTCWFSKPVCDRLVNGCHVCYYEPQGARECIV